MANTNMMSQPTDFSKIQFGAIFVFHDPRNWALDIQIMCDVIQGFIGGSHETNHTRKPVDLVFCNPDIIWQSDFEAPRMGQGAFRVAFQAVFQASLSFTAKSHNNYLMRKTVIDRIHLSLHPVWQTN
jgi:ribonucleotide monophosphatase NagD (HAD superfamily)